MRVCTRCQREQALDCFYNDAKGPGGRSRRCKECVNAAVKRYRDENPEKIAALKRADNRTELAKLRTRRYAMSEKGAANRAATQVRSRRELQTSYLKRVMGLQGVEVPESLLELKREQLLSVRALRELKTVLADIQPQTGDTNVH